MLAWWHSRVLCQAVLPCLGQGGFVMGTVPGVAHSQPCPQGHRRAGAVAVGDAVSPRVFWGPFGLSLCPQRVLASPAGVASRLAPLQLGGCQGSVLSREQGCRSSHLFLGLQRGSLEESRHQPALPGIERRERSRAAAARDKPGAPQGTGDSALGVMG